MRWKVKVTNVITRLRKRTGPSTSYRISSYMYPGDSGIVVETKTVGGATWYKWEKENLWSCAKTSGGTKYLTFVEDLDPPKEEEKTEPAPIVKQPINPIDITLPKPPVLTTTDVSSLADYNGEVDWYQQSSFKEIKYDSDISDDQINQEIRKLKYNMDISYTQLDDIYSGDEGYYLSLQKKLHNSFNRNKTPYVDKELSKTFAYVFFTRPDLHILDRNLKLVDSEEQPLDIKYKYLYDNNPWCLKSLVKGGNANHDFLVFLSNEAESFEVNDTVIKTIEHGETYNGHKVIYGVADQESNAAGEMSIRYIDTVNLDVFKMHTAWVDYINKVSRGIFKPWDEYLSGKVLDYACSCYYFLCGADGSTILYWQKLTGVFPVNTGENNFSWDSGTLLAKPEINIKYMYSLRQSMDVFNLHEFNRLSKKAVTGKESKFKQLYSTDNCMTGSTLTHCPYVLETKNSEGQTIYRLMWYDKGQ